MKKMKKVFAMLLAMAMVLGMTVTAFASSSSETPSTSPKITVNKIAKPEGDKIGSADISFAYVIRPAAITTRNPTGWEFVNSAYATAYKKAYEVDSDVKAIQALIAAEVNNSGYTSLDTVDADGKTIVSSATATAINKAVEEANKIENAWTTISGVTDGTASYDVLDNQPGIYIIKIGQKGYTYSNMAAYVGFGKVIQDANGNYEYPDLISSVMVAKGAPTSGDGNTSKESTDETDLAGKDNNVVAVGDTLNYTITTVVPYVEPTDLLTLGAYVVKDAITGAQYNNDITVKYENGDEIQVSPVYVDKNGNTTAVMTDAVAFSINLNDVLDNNTHANEKITISYTAIAVSENTISNNVEVGHQTDENFNPIYGTDQDEVFTGEVAIYKKGENDENLAGAAFEVTKGDSTDKLTFRTVYKADNTTVDYYVYDRGSENTRIVTDSNGVATIKGLDIGTYNFQEVEAPEGYSINANPESGSIALGENIDKATSAADFVITNATMNDTKISELPSTGGIGTTIFTIAGCLIMIAAAGLFFASRRKNAAK